jgi:Zn-finger nucleic acid-binding protein
MRELAGCRQCGHVEMVQVKAEAGQQVGICPRCRGPLRAIGLLGAALLAQVRRYPWEAVDAQRPPPRSARRA